MMEIKFKATNPNNIEFTLSITMRLKDWKELQEQLSEKWPSWELSGKITSMLFLAMRDFEPPQEQTQ